MNFFLARRFCCRFKFCRACPLSHFLRFPERSLFVVICQIGEDGRAKVCVPCWRKLLTEWMDFSQKGVHLCQRHYTIAGGSSEAASNGQQSSTATLREVGICSVGCFHCFAINVPVFSIACPSPSLLSLSIFLPAPCLSFCQCRLLKLRAMRFIL